VHRGGGSVSASTPRCGGNKINQGGAETDRDAMGNGEGYPLPIRQGLLGSAVSSSNGVRGGARTKTILVHLKHHISLYCLRSINLLSWIYI